MRRPKARSLDYLRRSAAKGRLHAAYMLGAKLIEQRRSIIRDERMCAEGCDVLMSAYKAGIHRAGWDLAEEACAKRSKIDLPPEEIAELLLDKAIKTRDPFAALNLWYYYSHFIAADRLKRAFGPIAKRSAEIDEILHNELRDA